MSEKRVCLWVSLERPTEAQRDELLNTRGVTDIVEKIGLGSLFKRKNFHPLNPSNSRGSKGDEKIIEKIICIISLIVL